MKPPEQGAFLSLSAAAVREFFGESMRGLRLRTVGDVITMKGVGSDRGADVVSIEQRGRGGMFAHVEATGRDTAELLQLFRQAGYRAASPYFLLRRRPRDWVGIEHWAAKKPPVNQPFMRVWLSESRRRKAAAPRSTRRQVADSSETIDWRLVRRVLTADRATLSRPASNGRSTPQRAAARRNLEQFERLVEQVLPERERSENLQPRLERVMAQLEQASRERDAANEELVALQEVLDRERQERGAAERQTRQRRGRREFQAPTVTAEDVRAAEEETEPAPLEVVEATPPTAPWERVDVTEAEAGNEVAEEEGEEQSETATAADEADETGERATEVGVEEERLEAEGEQASEQVEERGSDEASDIDEMLAEEGDATEDATEQTSQSTAGEPTEDEPTEGKSDEPHDEQPSLDNVRFPEKKD